MYSDFPQTPHKIPVLPPQMQTNCCRVPARDQKTAGNTPQKGKAVAPFHGVPDTHPTIHPPG